MRKAFSLVEALIVIAIITTFGTILLSSCGVIAWSSFDHTGAETNMLQHTQTLQPEWDSVQISCARVDTDNNGYVRCTASGIPVIDEIKSPRQTMEAECTGGPTGNWWGGVINDGCVPIKHGTQAY